jgi:serine/threonine protein kinase
MVVKTISKLHSYDPPLAHGHLSPYNLFISDEEVLVGDLEFEALRKYAGLFADYKNKSAYTAPEILKEKGNTVITPKPQSDIYSLGMIIW